MGSILETLPNLIKSIDNPTSFPGIPDSVRGAMLLDMIMEPISKFYDIKLMTDPAASFERKDISYLIFLASELCLDRFGLSLVDPKHNTSSNPSKNVEALYDLELGADKKEGKISKNYPSVKKRRTSNSITLKKDIQNIISILRTAMELIKSQDENSIKAMYFLWQSNIVYVFLDNDFFPDSYCTPFPFLNGKLFYTHIGAGDVSQKNAFDTYGIDEQMLAYFVAQRQIFFARTLCEDESIPYREIFKILTTSKTIKSFGNCLCEVLCSHLEKYEKEFLDDRCEYYKYLRERLSKKGVLSQGDIRNVKDILNIDSAYEMYFSSNIDENGNEYEYILEGNPLATFEFEESKPFPSKFGCFLKLHSLSKDDFDKEIAHIKHVMKNQLDNDDKMEQVEQALLPFFTEEEPLAGDSVELSPECVNSYDILHWRRYFSFCCKASGSVDERYEPRCELTEKRACKKRFLEHLRRIKTDELKSDIRGEFINPPIFSNRWLVYDLDER